MADRKRCEKVKEALRAGRAAAVSEHLAECADCRAFAESFGGVAEVLNALSGAAPAAGEEMLERTLRVAAAELTLVRAAAARRAAARRRSFAAAVVAAAFVPLITLLNYAVAAGGRLLLADWLSPAAGMLFFVNFGIGAAVAISVACGALPAVFAAAGGSSFNIPALSEAQGWRNY